MRFLIGVAKHRAEDRYRAYARCGVGGFFGVALHESAEHDDLAVAGAHNAVGFSNAAFRERQRDIAISKPHDFGLIADLADAGMNMQDNAVVFVDLRSDVERDP